VRTGEKWRRSFVALLFVLVFAGCETGRPRDAPQPGSGVADLTLPGGGTERVLYRQPEQPVAVVVLFAGGDGVLSLDGGGRPAQLGGNFLIRMREEWMRRGFAIAIPDAPSNRGLGMGAGDAAVARAVVAHIRTLTDKPIWLVGTSRGSVRAANAAAALTGGEIAGLVLTSSVSRPGGLANASTVFSASLDRVVAPTLIAAHSGDRCVVTPPSDAATIRDALKRAPKTEVMMFDGGAPPRSDACEAFSEHGFLGIETRVVERIADWIKAQ
jgi:hypothetical protein